MHINEVIFIRKSPIKTSLKWRLNSKLKANIYIIYKQIKKIGKGLNGKVVLDDCNFHESVNTLEFDMNRTLRIQPPNGEFIAMNYRITSEF